MCTCPTYLEPLALFKKRIAYANAYHTDFVVPTQTAAFLNVDSTYPHHVSDIIQSTEEIAINSDDPKVDAPKSDLIVATLHTPRLRKRKISTVTKTYCSVPEESIRRDKHDDDRVSYRIQYMCYSIVC